MKDILIIANARIAGGLSGSDNIYLNFVKHWPGRTEIWSMMAMDYKPFWLCYLHKIWAGCCLAIRCGKKYDFIYSGSDFLMDSLPALILKLKGNKWVAGFYLYAPKSHKRYWLLQQIAYWLIKWFADVVCITNGSMKWGFMDKKTIEVNGGVDLNLAGLSEDKEYDAVFCGRLHPTKGIKELVDIWRIVRKEKPNAKLALIGDGDLGIQYVLDQAGGDCEKLGIKMLGYMGDERFEVYKKSKMVLYPATEDHFSMSPVEAMACGCPLITFKLPVMDVVQPKGAMYAGSSEEFATEILILIEAYADDFYTDKSLRAYGWAKEWDWKARAGKVHDEIKEKLDA